MKFLVAVDGSDHAVKAARSAGVLAGAAGAEVIVVHQRSAIVLTGPTGVPDEDLTEAQAVVDVAVAAALESGAPSARGRIERGLHGEVAQAVLDVAAEEGADVIVVGPRGLGQFQGLLVGSVTERLVHHADRPVLVVR